MRNKKLSWLLLPIVLGIWGIIGWKIYEGMNNEYVPDIKAEIPIHVDEDSILFPIKYDLVLHYRDPFLGEIPLPVNVSINIAAAPSKQRISKHPDPMPSTQPIVQYYGLVKENKSQKTVGFLAINSQTYFVKTGEVFSGVLVGRIWADSIEISIDNIRRFVRR